MEVPTMNPLLTIQAPTSRPNGQPPPPSPPLPNLRHHCYHRHHRQNHHHRLHLCRCCPSAAPPPLAATTTAASSRGGRGGRPCRPTHPRQPRRPLPLTPPAPSYPRRRGTTLGDRGALPLPCLPPLPRTTSACAPHVNRPPPREEKGSASCRRPGNSWLRTRTRPFASAVGGGGRAGAHPR